MSRRYGQNFLVSRAARERVFTELVQAGRKGGCASPGELAWELGPGIGSMTVLALEAGLELLAFEIDHGFARVLSRTMGPFTNFTLVEGDFLHTWRGALRDRGRPALVLGNLPYNAAAAMIAAILEGFDLSPAEGGPTGGLPRRMVFTLQKEAARRLVATPGGKDYSAFSVLCGAACKVRLAFDLGASSFWPAPRVTGTVVVMEPRPAPLLAGERRAFSRFVRSGFASRRKTLKNNLLAAGMGEAEVLAAIEAIGAAPGVRAEALDPAELAALYRALSPGRASP